MIICIIYKLDFLTFEEIVTYFKTLFVHSVLNGCETWFISLSIERNEHISKASEPRYKEITKHKKGDVSDQF
jgi:hypothetical protein